MILLVHLRYGVRPLMKHVRKVVDMQVLAADSVSMFDQTAGAGHLVRSQEWNASGETVRKVFNQGVERIIPALCSFTPRRATIGTRLGHPLGCTIT